jgi:hypothetical protein
MNALDKAAYNRMVSALSHTNGTCRGLAEIKIPRIMAACPDEELRAWSKMARQSARILMEFAARFENNSASGIADEEATSAARYLGSKGGRTGGSKGGVARMDALTTEQRRELGRMAAAARWKDKPAAASSKVRAKKTATKGAR